MGVNMKARVVLIEGYDETRFLSKSLIDRGYHVTAINENMQNCESLAEIDKLQVFHGDGSKPFVLDDAGIYNADIVVAMSNHDDVNLVICELCKKKFNVKKTIAIVSDPKKTEFFLAMGVDSVVCAITAISNIIEQHVLLNDISTVMPIGEGKIQVVQINIPPTAPVIDKCLWEIELPEEVIVGCVLRGKQSLVPRGNTRILANDNLILIVSNDYKEAAVHELTGQ